MPLRESKNGRWAAGCSLLQSEAWLDLFKRCIANELRVGHTDREFVAHTLQNSAALSGVYWTPPMIVTTKRIVAKIERLLQA